MFSKNSFPVLLEHWRYIADLEPWITNRKSDNSQFQKKINQTQKTVFRIFVSLIIPLLSRVFPFSTLIFSLFQENILIWCMLSEFRAKLISLSGSYNEEHCSTVYGEYTSVVYLQWLLLRIGRKSQEYLPLMKYDAFVSLCKRCCLRIQIYTLGKSATEYGDCK